MIIRKCHSSVNYHHLAVLEIQNRATTGYKETGKAE